MAAAIAPAPSLTSIGHGINNDRFGPGAPAALVPWPTGLSPHLGMVADTWPYVQDFFPGCLRDLQDLWGRAELEMTDVVG